MNRTLKTLGKLAAEKKAVEKATSTVSSAVTSIRGEGLARKAWWAVGGLLAIGAIVMFIREIPSMRREWRLMRM